MSPPARSDADTTLQTVIDALRLAFEHERPSTGGVPGLAPFAGWLPKVPLDVVDAEEFAAAARAATLALVRQLAAQPGLPPLLVLQLVDHPDGEVRGHAAARVADVDLLQRLMRDPKPKVRGRAVSNQLTSEDDLRRLAGDPRYEVRSCVAAHARTPRDVVQKLVDDKSSTVRWNLLFGPHNRDVELLTRLATDPDPTNASQARGLLFPCVSG